MFLAGVVAASQRRTLLPQLRSTTTNTGSPSPSWSVGKPAGAQAGDLVLILVSVNNNTGTGAPAGFTEYSRQVCNVDSQELCVFGRVLDGTEGSTFSGATAQTAYSDWAVQALAFSGVDAITPVVASSQFKSDTGNTGASAIVAPSVTVATAGSLLLFLAGVDATTANAAATTFSAPTGFTANATTTSPRNVSDVYSAVKANAASGASGTVSSTATLSTPAGTMGALLVISPPVAHPLTLTGTLPGGTVGVPYSATLTLGGVFTAPVAIDTSVGSLPAWMSTSVSGNTVTFSGTPTTAETDSFTVRATSSDSQVATSAQNIVVAAAGGTFATLAGTSAYGAELSNGNLSLRTYDGGGARTLESAGCVEASTANRYWEAHIDTVAADNYGTIGLASPGNTNAPGWVYEATPTSAGVNNQGHLYVSQSAVSAFFTYAAGDTLKFCLKNGSLWIGKVGSGWYGGGDPATGTGAMLTGITGLRGPSAGSIGTLEHKVTFNFGATSWADTPPAGATGWTK